MPTSTMIIGSLMNNTPMVDIVFVCIIIITLHHVVDLLRPFAKIKIKDVRSRLMAFFIDVITFQEI